tara:strand:- start:319 stop:1266 length:948 start_codon:yes stop_codon:yes gene_type:complete
MKNYNIIQKSLHKLILGNTFIQKSLYDLEKIIFSKKINDIKYNHHVFITSLPRSGTTILLNYIFSSKQFSSLTYRQMPFIMSPNLFSKISLFSSNKKKERAHSDGILYNLDSPEAFDEIFFSIFNNEETSIEIYNFISLILYLNNKKRYLSKNNSNYKRIQLLQHLLPNSFFLIPVRDPAQQAYSLFSQHKNFLKLQENDIFILKYMNYLGHFEFGKNHKPWFTPDKFYDPTNPNYWLEQWFKFYEKIYEDYKNNPRCLLIKYEKLIDSNYLEHLQRKLSINNLGIEFFSNKKKYFDINFNQELLKRSNNLYEKL